MATSSAISSSLLLARPPLSGSHRTHKLFPSQDLRDAGKSFTKRSSFKVQAAKLPEGVQLPKKQPNFEAPFAGFTRTAEIWNSRACMIGLIGTFIVELILNKGILQVIGVDVGKGLDIPL